MSHFYRRIFFWFLVAIFIVATLFISLYAAGSQVNLSWPLKPKELLQKTGALFVDTKPRGATIILIDKNRQTLLGQKIVKQNKTKTPAKIYRLLPGEYEVRFELDGYWPFVKEIWINPNEATYLENIELFLKGAPLKIRSTSLQSLHLSADGRQLLLDQDQAVLDLNNNDATSSLSYAEALKTLGSSFTPLKNPSVKLSANFSNNNQIIYATDFEIYYLDIKNNNRLLLTRYSQAINGLIWASKNYLIFSTAKEINALDLKQGEITNLLTMNKIGQPILNSAGDTLYFTAQSGGESGLYKLNLK